MKDADGPLRVAKYIACLQMRAFTRR